MTDWAATHTRLVEGIERCDRLYQPTSIRWGRPYLNYLVCLTALSRHVESAPHSFWRSAAGSGPG